jgi:flagellar hook-associated protein 2
MQHPRESAMGDNNMASAVSSTGLISGLNTESLITAALAYDQAAVSRIQDKIETLTEKKSAVKELRTTLLSLRNSIQDMRTSSVFDQYTVKSSDDDVMTAEVTGSDPVVGSCSINVLQLASATTAKSSDTLGGTIDPNAALSESGIGTEVSEGEFSINGVTFTVDPDTDSLNDMISEINSSSAGVTASYDSTTDTVTLKNTDANDTSIINLGKTDDDSNFLTATSLIGATQTTNSNGSTEVTSTRNIGAIDNSKTIEDMNFANGDITSGTFSVNGINISVDPTSDSLSDVLRRINDSDANVTATYDATNDTISIVSNTLGSRTVSFSEGTSNFLSVTNLDDATQVAGTDAQFKVNDGALQTRNTNAITDAVSGVTLTLLSKGTTTVTVSTDTSKVTDEIQSVLDDFNSAIDKIVELTDVGATLNGDSGISSISSYLWSTVFGTVSGVTDDYSSLIDLGITTGDDFDSETTSHLKLDTDTFQDALKDAGTSIEGLFTNADDTGVFDQLFDYLDEATKSTGFLNSRSKSNGEIDQQIDSLNDRITTMQETMDRKEDRLRTQFASLETLLNTLKTNSSSLSVLG